MLNLLILLLLLIPLLLLILLPRLLRTSARPALNILLLLRAYV